MPVCTPTLPPGSANAFGSGSTKSAVSQPFWRHCGGSSLTRAPTTHRTYAVCRASVLCGILALASANAWVPSWSSSCCDTAPTICVRPVGDVVVAQPETAVAMARASNGSFSGRSAVSDASGCRAAGLKAASIRIQAVAAGSDVEVGDLQRVVLDELATRLDHVAHERREDLVGRDGVFDAHL